MKVSKLECPNCDRVGGLVASTYSHYIRGVWVAGLEHYKCEYCDRDSVFADQARRNHERILHTENEELSKGG